MNIQEKVVRDIDTRDWLVNLTEDGVMDIIVDSLLAELRPLAAEAVRRSVGKAFPSPSMETMLARLRPILGQLRDLLEDMTLDPDLMAVALHRREQIFRAVADLGDFLFAFDRQLDSPEATVHPSADVIMQQGGTP